MLLTRRGEKMLEIMNVKSIFEKKISMDKMRVFVKIVDHKTDGAAR